MRDPLKGWAREDGSLAGALGFQYAPVDRAGLCLKLFQVMEAGIASDVARGVDDGLDPHGTAVFEVLLDPGVLVVHVEHYAAGIRADRRAASRPEDSLRLPLPIRADQRARRRVHHPDWEPGP